MGKIKKLLTVAILFFSVISCGNTGWFCRKNQNLSYGANGKHMISVYDMGITTKQLDSICVADALSQNFNDWINGYFIDFETRDTVFKHTFIKTNNPDEEVIYIVTEWRDSLAIVKRIKK